MPRRYRVGLLSIGVVAVAVAVLPLALGDVGPLGLGVAAVTAGTFLLCLRMRAVVRLGTEELSIRVAGVFSTSIPYRTITGTAPDADTGFVQGMGLRKLPHRTTGYLVGGPTVRIGTGETAVLVSTEAPEELSRAIEERRVPFSG
ncbi:hypothetical protein AC792_00860 [Arthrobacter sp. RIT-PI-e]|nr:hypothetical protein AC792_00860 [Arthrobacter sp. RIT-PI-e]